MKKTLQQLLFASLFMIPAFFYGQDCDIIWTDLDNTTVIGTTLKKVGTSGWNADAHSAQVIPANTDGYLIYEVTSTDNSQMIGFTPENTAVSGGDMEFRFYFTWNPTNASRYVRMVANGVVHDLGVGSYSIGNKFRIRRGGSTMYFEKLVSGVWTPLWNAPAYIPSGSSTLPELIVDCSLYYNNATITNAKIFCVNSYAVLKEKLDGTYHNLKSGLLKIKFEERYFNSSETLDVKIYNNAGTLVYQPLSFVSNTGVNLYEINLKGIAGFTDGNYYVVEITDSKKNEKFLRIKYND